MTASTDDAELAAHVAEQAGRLLLELRAGDTPADRLKDAGDRISHEYLMQALRAVRPGDAILSEEGADDASRLAAERVWIVDPLDGTREFGERGRTDWAVHVALVEGGRLTAGAVALPARGVTLTTSPPVVPAPPPADGRLRLLVSRTRPPVLAQQLAEQLDAELVPMGSAGAKAMAVLLGDGDVYAHGGGQYEWDSAAPVAVALAAGLHASRLDGSALEYNRPDPWLPDVLICRRADAGRVLATIEGLSS